MTLGNTGRVSVRCVRFAWVYMFGNVGICLWIVAGNCIIDHERADN